MIAASGGTAPAYPLAFYSTPRISSHVKARIVVVRTTLWAPSQ